MRCARSPSSCLPGTRNWYGLFCAGDASPELVPLKVCASQVQGLYCLGGDDSEARPRNAGQGASHRDGGGSYHNPEVGVRRRVTSDLLL